MLPISAMNATTKVIAVPSRVVAAEIAQAATATTITNLTGVAAAAIAIVLDLGRDLVQVRARRAVIARAATTAAGNRKLSVLRRPSAQASIRIRPSPSSQPSKRRWTRGGRSQVRDDGTRRRSVRATA